MSGAEPQPAEPGAVRSDLSRERFEMALRAGAMGTWRWDIPARVVDWDGPMQELFGYPAGTFPGTYEAYMGRLHPDDRPAQEQGIAELLRTRGEQFQVEHRVLLPDGTVRWVASTARLRLGPDGEPRELIGVSMDITARHQAEAARRLAESAEQAARDEAVASQRRLALLARLSQLLGTPLDVRVTLRQVADLAVEDFADWCVVDLVGGRGVDRLAVAHRDPADARAAEEASRFFRPDRPRPEVLAMLSSLEPVFVPRVEPRMIVDRVADPDYRELLLRLHLSSSITVPLVARGAGIGSLSLLRTHGRTFVLDDVALAAELGRRAGSLVEKAQLYQERDRVARLLQRSLLPPALPRVPEVDLGTFYRPWTAGVDVGGDFYDVFDLGECWWLVLGDVCGKGPAAAAVSASVRYALRALALDQDDPAAVLARLNPVLRSGVPPDGFTTLVLLRLTPGPDGVRVQMATGGHPPPLLRRSGAGAEPVPLSGSLLGLLPQVRVGRVEVALGSGDALLLYTDGLTESTGADGVELGEDGARGLFAAAPARGAQAVVDAVAAGFLTHAARIHDDVALLALVVR